MINTRHNQQRGFVTLMVASILLFIVSVTSFYAASALIMEQRVVANNLVAEKAVQAAEAGLGHAQAYLISVGPEAVADATTLAENLSNGSRFSVQLSFVNGSNELIDIVSTGFAPNDQTSKTHSERAILIGGAGALGFDEPVKATGLVDMVGNGSIVNLVTDYTVHAGGAASIKGNANTVISSGVSSDKSILGPDIVANDAILASVSDADLFQDHFGTSFADAVPAGGVTLPMSGAGNYSSSLSGVEGEVVQIDAGSGTVIINGNITVGSAANPVHITVEGGKLKLEGNVTIYGDIVTTGQLDMSGNGIVHGSIKSSGDMKLTGNGEVHGDALSDGSLDMAGNGIVNGVAYAAGATKIAGNAKIFGALLVGDSIDFVGNGLVAYTEGNISTYSSGGGTEYARLLGSWRNF